MVKPYKELNREKRFIMKKLILSLFLILLFLPVTIMAQSLELGAGVGVSSVYCSTINTMPNLLDFAPSYFVFLNYHIPISVNSILIAGFQIDSEGYMFSYDNLIKEEYIYCDVILKYRSIFIHDTSESFFIDFGFYFGMPIIQHRFSYSDFSSVDVSLFDRVSDSCAGFIISTGFLFSGTIVTISIKNDLGSAYKIYDNYLDKDFNFINVMILIGLSFII
jgi:hypothetical protein